VKAVIFFSTNPTPCKVNPW